MVETVESTLESLIALFELRSAHEVSELFLSPYVDTEIFLRSTGEPGPSLWIVNRSDVYDATLEMLLKHPAPGIAQRAKEKLDQRRSILTLIMPPVLDMPLAETPDYMIEDVLGHPLAPLDAIMYFTDHPLEDYRGSAALSLTRRVLEHPPNWAADLSMKRRLQDRFSAMLMNDPSPFVRIYCARIPILEPEVLTEAFAKENEPRVQALLLQNPATPAELVNKALQDQPREARLLEVALLDRRVDRDLRASLNSLDEISPAAALINSFLRRR